MEVVQWGQPEWKSRALLREPNVDELAAVAHIYGLDRCIVSAAAIWA